MFKVQAPEPQFREMSSFQRVGGGHCPAKLLKHPKGNWICVRFCEAGLLIYSLMRSLTLEPVELILHPPGILPEPETHVSVILGKALHFPNLGYV